MRILITGFEPFCGATENPSAELAISLCDAEAVVCTAVLPVSARRMPEILLPLLEQHQPDIVLGLGEARGSAVIRVERIAVNLLDFRTPDNDGQTICDTCIVPTGPAAYFTTLPVERVLDAIRAAGTACEASLSAGAYLCNQMMYLSLHWAAGASHRPRVGFLHLPSLPTQNTGTGSCATMELDLQARAVRAAVCALREQP